MNDETEFLEDDDENKLSLIQRLEHPKWKARQRAYKEISEIFY